MHATMPILFVTVFEGIRHLIRQRTGLATGTRIERIPLSRWLLDPRSTFLLARRMVLGHVTSSRTAWPSGSCLPMTPSLRQQNHG